LLSKNHDLQKILFGDIMYNDDLCKYLNLQYDAKENDDFKNAKLFKIYEDLTNTRDPYIIYMTYTHTHTHTNTHTHTHTHTHIGRFQWLPREPHERELKGAQGGFFLGGGCILS
jgi:hypothetical protein